MATITPSSPTREERIDQLAGALVAARRRMDFDLKERLGSERLRVIVEIVALVISSALFIWLKDSIVSPLPSLLNLSMEFTSYIGQIILVLILIALAVKGGRALKSYFGRVGEVRRTFSNEIMDQIKNLNIGLKEDVLYDILEKVSASQTFDPQKYAKEIFESSVRQPTV